MSIQVPLPSEKVLEDIVELVINDGSFVDKGLIELKQDHYIKPHENGTSYETTLNFRKLHRQVKLGNYGIADLILMSSVNCVIKSPEGVVEEDKNVLFCDVIELKNCGLQIQDVGQVCRYASAIKLHSGAHYVRPILIGSHLTDDIYYLNHLLEDMPMHLRLLMYSFQLNHNGIRFIRSETPHGGFDETLVDNLSFLVSADNKPLEIDEPF